MIYRKLGTKDIQASVIALGTYPIGGWMWGGTDEANSIKTIHAALDHGINLIDTAPMYGYGLAEEIVGKAVKGRRDKAIIATKCGIVWDTQDWPQGKGELHFYADENGLTSDTSKIRFYRYLKADSIIKEVEASLKRLDTDYIDLLQTHAQEATTPIDETMAAMEKLQKQGKIRAIGSSNVTASQLNEYVAAGTLDATQERYSYLDRLMEENGVLSACRTNHVSFIAYAPLEHGLLTGVLNPETEYPDGDFRKVDPRFSSESVGQMNLLLSRLAPIREHLGLTTSQLMLSWVIAKYEKMHIISGMRNAAEVAENAKAGVSILAAEEIREIEELFDRFQWNVKAPKVYYEEADAS